MWIITSIILGSITILLLISNSYMTSDEDIDKAMQEWKRFKD